MLRIRYVKVAEYQARGIVHFHAVIRRDPPGQDYQPPPVRYTAVMLCDAIDQAASTATVTTGSGLRLGFGARLDPHRFRRHHPKWHDGLRGENRTWDRLARSTPRSIRTKPWSW